MKGCNLPGCQIQANSRCSRCQIAYYCSSEHQKIDWKNGHKIECNTFQPIPSVSAPVVNEDSSNSGESRECRCMFCGLKMVLSSEEKAIDHMKVCPNLQQQISSEEQFVLPSKLNELLSKANS